MSETQHTQLSTELPDVEDSPRAVRVAEELIQSTGEDTSGVIDFDIEDNEIHQPVNVYFDGRELRLMFWYDIEMPPFKMPDPRLTYRYNGSWELVRVEQQHLNEEYDSNGLGKQSRNFADEIAGKIEEVYL